MARQNIQLQALVVKIPQRDGWFDFLKIILQCNNFYFKNKCII